MRKTGPLHLGLSENDNHPPAWALAVLVPSLVLGHFRERHASLLPPMILHPLFNLTYLLGGIAG